MTRPKPKEKPNRSGPTIKYPREGPDHPTPSSLSERKIDISSKNDYTASTAIGGG